MLRRVIAGLVLVGMAIGVWLLWPVGEEPIPSSTTALAVEPSTTVTSSQATTVASAATSTIAPDDHIVETVEEAEAILRELWFGWFEGIYNQDEDRIREVVATEETVQTALESFGIEFAAEPSSEMITFSETEILRSDSDCLAVWTVMALSGFREGSSSGVQVLRRADGEWVQLSVWTNRNDLWEADCDSLLS